MSSDTTQPPTPDNESIETEIPGMDNPKIPLWIKLMWLGAVLFILWYIIFGLQASPTTWA